MASGTQEALKIGDGLRLRAATMLAAGTISDRLQVIRADASAGNMTLTLPPVSGLLGQLIFIKKIDSSGNIVTIAASGSETIDGASTQKLTSQYEGVILIADTAGWFTTDPVASGVFDTLNVNQPADASGTPPPILTLTGGAHTGVLAEQFDVSVKLARTVTFAGGGAPISTQRAVVIDVPTYAASAAQTITTAATLAIIGAPAAGANMTITNAYALWVQAGNSAFAGSILSTSTTAFSTALQLGGAQKFTYDGANSTGLMNAGSAQTFAVYNTFAAGTPDYERLSLTWSSNVAVIKVEVNGTGTGRTLQIRPTSSSSALMAFSPTGYSSAVNGRIALVSAVSCSATSGTEVPVLLNPSYSDGGTNSTTVVNALSISPTVNYTGGSKTGKVYLQYFNPTLTSQPTGNNAGLVFSSAFTSSTFPAMRFFNTADEDTNPEWFEQGWHIAANVYGMRVSKIAGGTLRNLNVYYAGSTSIAFQVGIAVNGGIVLNSASPGATASSSGMVDIGAGGSVTATSGTHIDMRFHESYAPTSTSTMFASCITCAPTINYSAGTPGAGYVYGLYVAPVNTALPTGRSAGIALSSTACALTGALILNNQVDEQTNYEQLVIGAVSNVWTFNTVKGGTGTVRAIRFQASGAGGWTIDANNILFPSTALATNMTTGFSSIVGAAGAATGVPATTTGFPIYWDSTNLKIMIYSGGAWKTSPAAFV